MLSFLHTDSPMILSELSRLGHELPKYRVRSSVAFHQAKVEDNGPRQLCDGANLTAS